MDEYRIFYHLAVTRFDTALGLVIALEQRSVATEDEARKLRRGLFQRLLDHGITVAFASSAKGGELET